jgi:hypothetical protein
MRGDPFCTTFLASSEYVNNIRIIFFYRTFNWAERNSYRYGNLNLEKSSFFNKFTFTELATEHLFERF